jgi:hypothetical protein
MPLWVTQVVLELQAHREPRVTQAVLVAQEQLATQVLLEAQGHKELRVTQAVLEAQEQLATQVLLEAQDQRDTQVAQVLRQVILDQQVPRVTVDRLDRRAQLP